MPSSKPSSNNYQSLWIGVSFLVVGLALGMVINSGGASLFDKVQPTTTGTQAAAADAAPSLDPATLPVISVSSDNDAVLGDPNAPITIVEFSDFQCPFCGKFYDESYASLKADYIDTGIAKLVFRDFPLPSHKYASMAAQAAECVRAAGAMAKDEQFFQMHDLLFAHQSEWFAAADPKAAVEALAKDNLNVDISECLDKETMKAEVEADYTAGRSYGINGTPTFFIQGKKVVGAWPYDMIKKVIESVR